MTTKSHSKNILLKGQMIFEFLIASLIFFVIIVFLLNFINTNISKTRENYRNDIMTAKLIQISDVMMNPLNKKLSIVSDTNIFNAKKINDFKTEYCDASNPDEKKEKYNKLLTLLELKKTASTGYIIRNNINITLMDENGNILLTCGKRYPGYFTAYKTQRIGVYNNKLAKLVITIW